MFISCMYDFKQIDSQGKYGYDLIDSEFEEKIRGGLIRSEWALEQIITAYERRNIKVGHNLMLAIVWFRKEWPMFADTVIEHNKGPKFAQYKNDIDKYMVLL